jgi:DNA polymerase V
MANINRKNTLTFIENTLTAGFPSPAGDYIENDLDLNNYLIHHPASTFIIRVSGSSMIEEGISDGDLLIVDRSIQPECGQIVIAEINGEYTVKKIGKVNNLPHLIPANKEFQPIPINEENQLLIWGVVIYNIHKNI